MLCIYREISLFFFLSDQFGPLRKRGVPDEVVLDLLERLNVQLAQVDVVRKVQMLNASAAH